jgi:dimethylargininase
MLTALTRGVSPTLGDCELEYHDRQPIDVAKAVEQHRAYQACLADLGLRVVSLPANPECPDGVFVEDPAVVTDEIAVMNRMGSVPRRKEVPSLAEALSQFRPLKWLRKPATLEGGDVMRIGKTLYVGISRRTNREGASQLAELLEPFGYRIVPVPVDGCLHLKSACCYLGDDRILANREWIESGALDDFQTIDVPADEPSSANVLRIGDTVLIPSAYPKTRELLQQSGYKVRPIDTSELLKAEAGVTCMSIVFSSVSL